MDLTPVSRLMTRNVVTLEREQSLLLAQDMVRAKRILHLPIVDEREHLVGIVSQMQLLAVHARLVEAMGSAQDEAELTIPVSHVMETDVQSVAPDTLAADALELMLRESISALPVVEDRKVVGILTRRDFLSFELGALRAVVERSHPESRVREGMAVAAAAKAAAAKPPRKRERRAAQIPTMPQPHASAAPATDALPTQVRHPRPTTRPLVRRGFLGAAAAALLIAGFGLLGPKLPALTSASPAAIVEAPRRPEVVVVALKDRPTRAAVDDGPASADAVSEPGAAEKPGAAGERPATTKTSAPEERRGSALQRQARPAHAKEERSTQPQKTAAVDAPPAVPDKSEPSSQPLAYNPGPATASGEPPVPAEPARAAKPAGAAKPAKVSARPAPAKRTWVPEPLPYDLPPPR